MKNALARRFEKKQKQPWAEVSGELLVQRNGKQRAEMQLNYLYNQSPQPAATAFEGRGSGEVRASPYWSLSIPQTARKRFFL